MNNQQNSYYILVIIFLLFMAGSFSYCFGFITGSMSSDKLSQKGNPYVNEMVFKNDEQKAIYQKQWFPTQSNQTIFYIEDGLAYYLAVNEYEQEKQKQQYSSQENIKSNYSTNVLFKELLKRLKAEPSNSILLKSYTHPPTLTATSLRATVQGNLPSYMSIMSNMGSIKLSQDNIVYQAKFNNPFKETDETRTKVLFYGSQVWNSYFGDKFDSSGYFEEDDSIYFRTEKEQMNNQDWSTMFLHFTGIDQVSHRIHNLYDKEFLSILEIKSGLVGRILENTKQSKVNTDQTVILMSDHGLDFNVIGHHGGYNVNETNSLIFGYTKNGFIQKEQKDIGQIMDRKFLRNQTFNINAASTFCMLQGLPIPANNLGMMIPDFFINKPEIDDFVIANNYYTNFRQVEDRFLDACSQVTGGIDGANEIQQLASELKKQYKNVIEGQPEDLKKFVESCIQFSVRVVDIVRLELKDPKLLFMWEGLIIHFLVSVLILSSLLALRKVSHMDLEMFESITNTFNILIKKLKLVLAISLIVYGLFYVILKAKTFLSFQLVFISCITLYSIFLTTNFLFQNKGHQIIKEQQQNQENNNSTLNKAIKIIDSIFLVASVVYFTFSRTTNDIFMNSFDYYLYFTDFYCYLLLLFTVMRLKTNKIKKSLIILLQIAAIPIILYYIGQYSSRASHLTKRINKDYRLELLLSEFYSQTLPMCIFYIFFIFLIFKIWKSMKSKCSIGYKCFFLYQNFVLVNSVYVFYYCLWNKIDHEQSVKTIPAISVTHMILGEIVKYIYLKKNKIHFSTNWKIFTSSINFILGFMYLLEANSLISIPLFFIVIYLVCNVCVSLKIISLTNMFIFLFYFSQLLFFSSGHTELFSELHVQVFQYMNFLKGNLIPTFNGTINTYFYFIITTLLLPIFNSLTKLDSVNQNHTSVSIINHVLDINIVNSANTDGEQQTDDDNDIEVKLQDQSSFTLIKQHDQQINSQYLEQCSYSLNCLVFLSPIIIGFNGADIRNILKPQETQKESFYMPNYLFQLLFLAFYFSTMTYNLIALKSRKK